MKIERIYRCLTDPMRVRILSVLNQGPLCVCHIQEILNESQVKTSKQLAYMKKMGALSVRREGAWNIYSIDKEAHPVLKHNLDYLNGKVPEYPIFEEDLKKREQLIKKVSEEAVNCPDEISCC
jgi:ArsR family transcriptional regulator